MSYHENSPTGKCPTATSSSPTVKKRPTKNKYTFAGGAFFLAGLWLVRLFS